MSAASLPSIPTKRPSGLKNLKPNISSAVWPAAAAVALSRLISAYLSPALACSSFCREILSKRYDPSAVRPNAIVPTAAAERRGGAAATPAAAAAAADAAAAELAHNPAPAPAPMAGAIEPSEEPATSLNLSMVFPSAPKGSPFFSASPISLNSVSLNALLASALCLASSSVAVCWSPSPVYNLAAGHAVVTRSFSADSPDPRNPPDSVGCGACGVNPTFW